MLLFEDVYGKGEKGKYKGYNCAEVSLSQCKVLRENSDLEMKKCHRA